MAESRHLASAANKWKILDDNYGYGIGYVKNIAEKIVQNETETTEEKVQKLETLRQYAIELHKVSVESELRRKLLSNLAQIAESSVDCDADQLQEQFKQGVNNIGAQIANLPNDDPPDVAPISKLLHSVCRADGSDDDVQEDIAASQPRQLRCPILNSTLVNPYKNTQCNHVYSLLGVLQILYQMNQTHKASLPTSLSQVPSSWTCGCPIVGCKGKIKVDCLKRDYEMEVTQRQIQSSLRRDADDIDDVA